MVGLPSNGWTHDAEVFHSVNASGSESQQIIDKPDLLVRATEEFLRFTSVNETLTRTVAADVELGAGSCSGPTS